MISAIAGDIIGSRFEFHNSAPFDSFFSEKSVYTDDTVLTVATADTILNNGNYSETYLRYATDYPGRGYGGMFGQMIGTGKLIPYNSYGNGSIMRIAPVGWISTDIKTAMTEARRSAEVSHNHPEGILAAQAVSVAMYMARCGYTKSQIKNILEDSPFNYDLSRKPEDFTKEFDETCQGTLPRCFSIFFDSDSFEEAMGISYLMGGDIDTNNCVVGSLCDAYYGLPSKYIIDNVYSRLSYELANITTLFVKKYIDDSFVEPKDIATKTSTYAEALAAIFSYRTE